MAHDLIAARDRKPEPASEPAALGAETCAYIRHGHAAPLVLGLAERLERAEAELAEALADLSEMVFESDHWKARYWGERRVYWLSLRYDEREADAKADAEVARWRKAFREARTLATAAPEADPR